MRARAFGFDFSISSTRTHMCGKCFDCHWWHASGKSADGKLELGHCRRHSPSVAPDGRTLWPRTISDHGCGNFRDRVKEAKKP